ncbi:hypothetical protein M0805_003294 [Coniferiporia weirii]|nr:hypothetical protein M0805_003294 [Coniferiporia weirii]
MSASSTPKKSLRSRMGTVVRRASSFGIARPRSDTARSDSEPPASTAGSPPRSIFSSKPPSIRSVEPPAQPPLAAPDNTTVSRQESITSQDVTPNPEPETEAMPTPEPPKRPLTPEVPPVEEQAPVRAPTPTPIAAPVAEPEPVPESKPEPEPTIEVTPQRVPEPVSRSPTPPPAPVVERRGSEPRSEQQSEPDYGPRSVRDNIPVSDSPKSLSRSSSHDSFSRFDRIDNWPGVEQVQAAAIAESSPKSSPKPPLKQLSVTVLSDAIVHDLSPIVEDEYSAVETRNTFAPFTHPDSQKPPVSAPPRVRTPPPAPAPVAPVMSTGFSHMSGGTTPRPTPLQIQPERTEQSYFVGEKGKEREQNGSAVPQQQDSYFPSTAPMDMPSAAQQYVAPFYIATHTVTSPSSYDVEDPFRDPEPAPGTTMPYGSMPQQSIVRSDSMEQRAAITPMFPMPPSEPVALPLPPLGEVTARDLRNVPSDYTLAARSSREPSVRREIETDETVPLLSRFKNPAGEGPNNSTWTSRNSYEAHGWDAYVLPDSTTYYSHQRRCITTDIDIQNPRKLSALAAYLNKLSNETFVLEEGWEIWLHDNGLTREPEDFVLMRCWVDHNTRALGYWPPPSRGSDGPVGKTADDRLDLEYKYWAFMESHPAHVPLPANAYSEALDALTWSYTERLLKTNRRAPPPFTQHESHELIELLRQTSESSGQAAVQTKIVSKILRRIVQWKQHFFRPEKPLPRGVILENIQTRTQRSTQYRRTFIDFVAAWLCFGIPYLYANRHAYQRYDEEGGLMRSAGPMLVVGASVCIVAAIILTASVTFLALPGQDQIARSAGLIAVLASTASLGSSVIAALRNHVEVQRMAARGGEGLVVTMSALTGDSIIPSLPAVFLAWSVLSFVTGIVLYAFRGTVMIDPSHWVKFASYTRWTTIGVCGFLGGVLIASMFFIRH